MKREMLEISLTLFSLSLLFYFNVLYLFFPHSIKAIGTRNLLKSISKQREVEQQQLQAVIAERQAHLER